MTANDAHHISRIRTVLDDIQENEDVQIIYACESGSRAWGFPSADSDFDVRFIYVRRVEWYLSVLEKRDVIERPFNDWLDVSGWDIKKALQLLRKSNPPLLEWLNSPIIYSENATAVKRLRELIPIFYSSVSCRYHYLSMAKGNFRDYLQGPVVSPKKYFYVLRPLLAIRWIDAGLGAPPTAFDKLLAKSDANPDFMRSIRELIEEKRSGRELDRGPRIEPISEFIENELDRLDSARVDTKINRPPSEMLDETFRSVIHEVWR